MSLAVHWTAAIFTILLLLPVKILSINCYRHTDWQCRPGCYLSSTNCVECENCTRTELLDLNNHPDECTSFPALCRKHWTDVPWTEYATSFHPLHLPPLKGSFLDYHDRWLITFFQEETHPTIGKLCINEAQKIPTEWYTFQKALLNCTGHGGVRYINLWAVKNHSYNTSLYFTLLSSPVDNRNQSALCLFTSTEITAVFNSGTFYDHTIEEEWTAFPTRRIPEGDYALGGCYGGNQWTDPQKSFISMHPMMYDNVIASQVLAEGDGVFTVLESIEKKGRDGKQHIIIFVGTDDGRILKYALFGLDIAPNFLEEIYVTENSSIGITDLEIEGETLQLKISTTASEEPLYEPLQRCSEITTECVCEQDPYCIWNVDDVSCRGFDWDYDSDKSEITKRTCEGISPGSALLITNKHNRPIYTTTVETEIIETKVPEKPKLDPPKKPDEVVVDKPSTTVSLSIIILCGVVTLIVLIPALFVLRTYLNRDCQPTPTDSKEWTSDWTSITFMQQRPSLMLKDTIERTEYKGEIVNEKAVVKNLKPGTDYEVSCPDELSPFIVSTKGPSFSGWVVTLNTVELKVAGWEAPFSSYLVLKWKGRCIQRKSIAGSLVKFSGLTPNMKLMVWLEVSQNEPNRVIEKHIKDVTTLGESFNVDKVNKPCLMWSNLSSSIHRFIRCCNCDEFQDFLTNMDNHMSGSKELPPLPRSAKFHLKVMTMVSLNGGKELEHTLATVIYETPDIDLVKNSEGSSLVQLPEDSSGLEKTTDEDALHSDDSSSRANSLPASEDLSVGLIEDSSSAIRSAPTLGIVSSLLSPPENGLALRQTSLGNEGSTVIHGNNNTIYVGCYGVNSVNGSSSSGVSSLSSSSLPSSSLPSSQSSFIDLPFKGYGIQIGEECYQCSATLNSLMELKHRHELELKIFLSKPTVTCLCELLNYSKDESDCWRERIKNPAECLRPITDKDYVCEQISVSTLIYKLMKLLRNFSQCNVPITNEYLKEMECLYNVIDFMATTVHKDCHACKPILDSVNHFWICGGFEGRCKDMNPQIV